MRLTQTRTNSIFYIYFSIKSFVYSKKVLLQNRRKISHTLDMITRYASITIIYIKLAHEPNRVLPVKDVLAPKKERTKCKFSVEFLVFDCCCMLPPLNTKLLDYLCV